LKDYLPDMPDYDVAGDYEYSHDFDVEDYYYNPFPNLAHTLQERGDIKVESSAKKPSYSIHSGAQDSGTSGIADILKSIEQLQSGKNAEDIFTTKPTKSTRYFPPIPTTPRMIVTKRQTVYQTKAWTPYTPPVKQYYTEPETTTEQTTTVTTTTTNKTETETTTRKTTTTKKPKTRKRPALKQGIPPSKNTGLSSGTLDSSSGMKQVQDSQTSGEMEKVKCDDLDAIKTTFKMCASSETEQLNTCRYTAFKTCVKKRAGHCPDTRDLFRYWNIDEENIHRFSLNEMICVEEAVKAGEEYCPVPKIITALEECLAEEQRTNNTIPSHNNLYVKDNCRFAKYKRCVNVKIGECHKIWEIWRHWNEMLEPSSQFPPSDLDCNGATSLFLSFVIIAISSFLLL